MPSTAKLTATLAALVLATTALAGCTATTAPQAGPSSKPTANAAPESSATPASSEADTDECAYYVKIHFSAMRAKINGKPVDRGERELAAGTVGVDDEGNVVSYTVAPGDAPIAIGERLCIEMGTGIPLLNHVRTIHPGQVLRLDPDPEIPWIPYFSPPDAPAGFQQIPYQHAIEAMGTAADADDIDTMRAIWADELSGMFSNPADIDLIQQALDAGDLDVLRQMFS